MKTNQNMDVSVGDRKEHPTTTDDLHGGKDQAHDVVCKVLVHLVCICVLPMLHYKWYHC